MLHGQASAAIINQYYHEMGMTLFEDKLRYNDVVKAIQYAFEHECRIIDLAIPGNELNGVKKQEYKEYVKHRLNIFCDRIQIPRVFVVGECSITDWFELNTVAYKVVDFFTPGQGNEYEEGWGANTFSDAFVKLAKEENING